MESNQKTLEDYEKSFELAENNVLAILDIVTETVAALENVPFTDNELVSKLINSYVENVNSLQAILFENSELLLLDKQQQQKQQQPTS
jgi:hypothetical protein